MNPYNLNMEFFTNERLTELFGYFGSLIKLASPVALISIAMSMCGLLLFIIVRMFRKGISLDKDNKERDYDIDYYD